MSSKGKPCQFTIGHALKQVFSTPSTTIGSTEIARALNRGLLPPDYYALPEQQAAGFGPDVLTLDMSSPGNSAAVPADGADASDLASGGVALAMPKLRPVAETDMAFYRRKQKTVTVRHVSGDRIVAIVEIVSPGNKSSLHAMWAFVNKAAELLEMQIHLSDDRPASPHSA